MSSINVESDDDKLANSLMKEMVTKAYERRDGGNVITFELDLYVTITRVLLNTGGYFYEEASKKLFKRNKPSMNARGLLRLAEILNIYLNKDVILSDLSMNDIRRTLRGVGINILTEFQSCQEEYGIDPAMFQNTYWMIIHIIYITLKRAYKRGALEHLERIMSIQLKLSEKNEGDPNKPVFK